MNLDSYESGSTGDNWGMDGDLHIEISNSTRILKDKGYFGVSRSDFSLGLNIDPSMIDTYTTEAGGMSALAVRLTQRLSRLTPTASASWSA